jgi:plastocyanin
MRVTSLVAGLALVLAACGGEKKADEAPATTGADTAAAATGGEAAAPAATGATHEVQMTMTDGKYVFTPAELTVKPGDVVRYVNGQGGPHNVSFWQDSIPSGAASAVKISEEMGPLTSVMLVEQGKTIDVTIASGAPAGEYKYYCQPHLAMGMVGKLTVQQ